MHNDETVSTNNEIIFKTWNRLWIGKNEHGTEGLPREQQSRDTIYNKVIIKILKLNSELGWLVTEKPS